MSVRTIRRIVLAVCVLGIAGMIVTSILDHVGAAITFGLVTASAVLCSMVATAVANAPGSGRPGSATAGTAAAPTAPDEAQAARVEALVGELVANGADEAEVRRLVGEAVRLGRSTG